MTVCELVIEDLYPYGSTEKSTLTISCDENESILELARKIAEAGCYAPKTLRRDSKEFSFRDKHNVVGPHEEVVVIANDAPSTRNTIRLDEKLLSHSNKFHSKKQSYEIKDKHGLNSIEPNRTIDDDRGFEMSLERTPRMPDDDKLHQLPASLGSFELYNVQAYADRLPANIADVGGIFYAMWQREALWISFRSRFRNKFAVRVFVGHVNAISGLNMDEPRNEEKGDETMQDYLVIPGQQWLDGICVAPGVVRQFVAMPLGSGYTVEGQKTSEEKHGGLQIEIIPEYDSSLRFWRKANPEHEGLLADGTPILHDHHMLSESSTPGGLQCSVGDVFRTYSKLPKQEPLSIRYIMGTNDKATFQASYPAGKSIRRERQQAFGQSEHNRVERECTRVLQQSPPSVQKEPYFGPSVQKEPSDGPSAFELSLSSSVKTTTVAEIAAQGSPYSEHQKLSYCSGVPQYPRMLTSIPIGTSTQPEETTAGGNPSLGQVSFGAYGQPYTMVEKKAVQINALPGPFDSFVKDGVASLENAHVDLDMEDEADAAGKMTMDPDVETRDLKSMGLAAGGKLIQDIYKDMYEAHIWNHDAARIIHIHILDPISCEKVTHIVPRPPPSDAKAYADAGGQFFVVEEKVDERLDGGDFDNVKSVSQMDAHVGVTTEPEFDPSKPKMCTTCQVRLCDCIIRPCDHQFCNVCIKKLEEGGDADPILARRNWKCPTCHTDVARVAGFSAPMNLPGEETVRMKVPVSVLKVEDGRIAFSSIQKTRI